MVRQHLPPCQPVPDLLLPSPPPPSSAAKAKFFISLIGGVVLLLCTHSFFAVAAIPHPGVDEEEGELSWNSGLRVHTPQICR